MSQDNEVKVSNHYKIALTKAIFNTVEVYTTEKENSLKKEEELNEQIKATEIAIKLLRSQQSDLMQKHADLKRYQTSLADYESKSLQLIKSSKLISYSPFKHFILLANRLEFKEFKQLAEDIK